MKKLLSILLAAIVLICALVSCNKPEEFVNPWEDPNLSERDAAIRTISDAAIMQKYGLEAKDIYLYEISINEGKQGGFIVYYKLCFYGYDTYEHYWVNLSSELALENVTDSDLGTYSRFISRVTETSVRDAEKELDEKLKKYEGVSEKFLSIDENGNLCLTVEVIENIVPPIADENGNTEGCGLDHKHTLITSVVCEK
jgi:hypothetical protein